METIAQEKKRNRSDRFYGQLSGEILIREAKAPNTFPTRSVTLFPYVSLLHKNINMITY